MIKHNLKPGKVPKCSVVLLGCYLLDACFFVLFFLNY